MTEKKTMSVSETARRSKTFLDGIGKLASDGQLPRDLVLNLFGLFAKYIVELNVGDGDEHAEATMNAMHQFLRGMGVDTVMEKVEGDKAEQMRAEFERAGGGHPVQ
jgi:hypothetical protein